VSEAREAIQIWRQDDGLWRWRWEELQDGEVAASLMSFMAFDSREEARESARESYPQLRVDGLLPAAEEQGRSAGTLVRVAALFAVALLVVAFRRRVGHQGMGTSG